MQREPGDHQKHEISIVSTACLLFPKRYISAKFYALQVIGHRKSL